MAGDELHAEDPFPGQRKSVRDAITFEALDRRVAFTPTFPELWFEVTRGQSLLELNTSEFGVPQLRPRVVFIGLRTDLNPALNPAAGRRSRERQYLRQRSPP